MNQSDIYSAYSNALAAANAANVARANEIRGGYDTRALGYSRGAKQIYGQWNDLLDRQARIGDSQRLDLQDQYARQLGKTQAGLYAKGLGNSTVMNSAMRGANNDLARNKIALSDSLAREYAAVDQNKLGFMANTNMGTAGLAKDKLDFIERINDIGPQAGLYAELAGKAGQADAGPAAIGQGGGGFNMGGGGTRGANPAAPGFVPPYDQNQILNGLNPSGARTANAQAQTAYNQTLYPAAMNAAAMGAANVGGQMMGPNFGNLFGAMGQGQQLPMAQIPQPDNFGYGPSNYGYGAYNNVGSAGVGSAAGFMGMAPGYGGGYGYGGYSGNTYTDAFGAATGFAGGFGGFGGE